MQAIPQSKKKKTSKVDPVELGEYIRKHPQAGLQQISEHFGCSKHCIFCVIRYHAIEYTPKRYNKLPTEKLRRYIEDHPEATMQEIATFFGCSRNAVHMAIRAKGIAYTKKSSKGEHTKQSVALAEQLESYIKAHPEAKQKDIAAVFGCSDIHISRTIRRYGVSYSNKRRCPFKPEELIRYLEDNPAAIYKDIAAHFNRSATAIYSFCKYHQICFMKIRREAAIKTQLIAVSNYITGHPKATLEGVSKYFSCDISFMKKLLDANSIKLA